MSGHEGTADTHRLSVQPVQVELVAREVGADNPGDVLAQFAVPVLVRRNETSAPGWTFNYEAMKDDLMRQVKKWALTVNRTQDQRKG